MRLGSTHLTHSYNKTEIHFLQRHYCGEASSWVYVHDTLNWWSIYILWGHSYVKKYIPQTLYNPSFSLCELIASFAEH